MIGEGAGPRTDPHWERLQDLFLRASDLPENERDAFVARECGGDDRLRTELLELLIADAKDASGSLLTHALGAAIEATTRDHRKALVGRILSNYRLASVLGHGGTGTVYLAERADRQYSAQVAIKVVDSLTPYGALGLRFRAERQILAGLNHSNIARLLDAGETQEGQPYLVMEYVHGEALDRYCDRKNLSLQERLRLFLQICNAVQYAHQNLVVHRDLKPANILVTEDGTPKLLDFGIAKLLDTDEAASALALTRMNDRLLTPEYASPEQILGRPVTTSSDVYALGVILYELMTGMRPYTVSASASQLELERSICVSDPLRPSAAVVRVVESASMQISEIAAIAAARELTSEKLARRLAGDLDAIVMRALRKEPEHRYGSVEQLAGDIRRYLQREPVIARQGNWVYYSQRFVRRHAFGVAASTAFVLFTLAFAVVTSIQAQRIATERDRAEQESQRAETVSDFMLDVFSASDPFERPGEEVTAKQLLDAAGARIHGDLSQQPEVRARLLEAIGRAYRRQHLNDRAIEHLQEARDLRRQISGGGDEKTVAVLSELAIALRQSGDLSAAERILAEAVELSSHSGSQHSLAHADLLLNLGRMQLQAGDPNGAQKYFEQSLELNMQLLGPRHPEVASVLTELSAIFLWQDNARSAEQAAREAVQIYRASLPRLHPDRVVAESRLAETLQLQNRLDEAEPLFMAALRDQQILYGENSRQAAYVLDSLASIKRSQGLFPEAEKFARQAVDAQKASLGDGHYMTAYFRTSLASVLLQRQQHSEAEDQLRHALKVYEKTLPPDHQYIAASEHLLGELLLATNRFADAEAVLTAAVNRWKRTDAAPWRSARSASSLGEALHRQGRTREAEKYLVEGYRTLVADAGADADARSRARERLTRFYTSLGRKEKLNDVVTQTARDGEKYGVR